MRRRKKSTWLFWRVVEKYGHNLSSILAGLPRAVNLLRNGKLPQPTGSIPNQLLQPYRAHQCRCVLKTNLLDSAGPFVTLRKLLVAGCAVWSNVVCLPNSKSVRSDREPDRETQTQVSNSNFQGSGTSAFEIRVSNVCSRPQSKSTISGLFVILLVWCMFVPQ